MVDLVKCLREHQGENDPPWMACIMDEAADEIERLQERVAELQAECGYTEDIKAVEIERLMAQLAIAMDALRRINAKTEENIAAMSAINIHKRGEL